MFKKLLSLIVFGVLFSIRAKCSHLMGGEITWDCQGSGQYVFTMKLYRDCNGITPGASVLLTVTGHPTVFTIPLALVSQKDISPSCNAGGPSISCGAAQSQTGWPNSGTPIAGAVQEYVFQSSAITLTGVPGTNGWIFTYDDCCRNGAISNLQNASLYGFTLKAVMYAYNGLNASPCFDSSPRFLESPASIMCVGYPFTYNPNASDPDLDSLSYSWAAPYDDFVNVYNPPTDPVAVPFNAGYSVNSPLPGTIQNPANVPATINAQTGEISYTSYTQGNFVTAVKVEAWRCGQLIAEVYREMQVVLLPCTPNNAPVVTFSSYQSTVAAGTLVNFTLNATDNGFLPDGVTPQTVAVTATGTQFGAGYTNASSGCLNPPCATLNTGPPISGQGAVSTVFNWQTDCNHTATSGGCNPTTNTYTFVFKTKDDFCPVPAENISTVSITVVSVPVVKSPQPRCVSVLPNGNVTITWSRPLDPGGTFDSYHIFSSSSSNGPYTLLTSISNYNQTSYTHTTVNANTAPVYYYIQSRSGCNGQVYSAALDTVSSIKLNVINPANGTAVLNWNPIATPNISSSSGSYNVFQENPLGTWTQIGTTTQKSYIDTIEVCNAPLNYRVEIADTTGCISVSSVDGSIFQNIIVPAIPVFDTLSVDDNNNAQMSWNVNPSADTEGYIVYQFNGTTWVPVATISGINTLSYTYLLSSADLASEQYRLAAFDTCGNVSPLGAIQSTIHLTATSDICTRSAILSWTAYGAIGTGLGGYRIYKSTVGSSGPFTFVASVSSGTLTYTESGLPPNTMYYYKIEAFNNSGTKTASSNRLAFYSVAPIPPTFTYLRKASVLDPNQVDITCHVDIAASSKAYKIMKSTTGNAGSYSLVGTVAATGITPIVYRDKKVLTDSYSYFYKMINVDSCGYDGLETNIGHTILLSAVSNSNDFTNTLTWNDYEQWLGNVMSYNIYRGIDGVMNTTPIANVPYSGTGVNTFVDDISSEYSGEGVFNYYVEAIEGFGNPYGFGDNSLSNIAEAYQNPLVYIPNAFKPNGLNPVFIPITTYVDLDEYELIVFNRWGQKVFATKDINTGWDGTYAGNKSELGVYVYLLNIKTSKGEYITKKGSVTLLR